MKRERVDGIATAVVAVLLLAEGGFTVWGIGGLQNIEVVPNSPFGTAEDVARARSYLPAMYVVAIEGLLFGAIALVGAGGIFTGRVWARRMVLGASVLLAVTACIAIAMVPHQWDTQGIFVLFCVLLWWESWNRRQK